MTIDSNTPGAEHLIIALDGEVVGYVLKADTDKGYIVQAKYSPEHQMFFGHETRHGKVVILGNNLEDDPPVIRKRLNGHRIELGLPPIEEAVEAP